MLRSLGLAETVGGLYFLYHLEEPCPARDTEGLDGGAGRQADGLFRPALICDHKGGSERIKTAFHTFHGGIEGLEVDGDVGFINVRKSLIFSFSLEVPIGPPRVLSFLSYQFLKMDSIGGAGLLTAYLGLFKLSHDRRPDAP